MQMFNISKLKATTTSPTVSSAKPPPIPSPTYLAVATSSRPPPLPLESSSDKKGPLMFPPSKSDLLNESKYNTGDETSSSDETGSSDETSDDNDDIKILSTTRCQAFPPDVKPTNNGKDLGFVLNNSIDASDTHLISCHHEGLPRADFANLLADNPGMPWPRLKLKLLTRCHTFCFAQIVRGVAEQHTIAFKLRQSRQLQQFARTSSRIDEEIEQFLYDLAFPSRSQAQVRLQQDSILRGTSLDEDHFAQNAEQCFIRCNMKLFLADFYPSYAYQPYVRFLTAHAPSTIICCGELQERSTRAVTHIPLVSTNNKRKRVTINTGNTQPPPRAEKGEIKVAFNNTAREERRRRHRRGKGKDK